MQSGTTACSSASAWHAWPFLGKYMCTWTLHQNIHWRLKVRNCSSQKEPENKHEVQKWMIREESSLISSQAEKGNASKHTRKLCLQVSCSKQRTSGSYHHCSVDALGLLCTSPLFKMKQQITGMISVHIFLPLIPIILLGTLLAIWFLSFLFLPLFYLQANIKPLF